MKCPKCNNHTYKFAEKKVRDPNKGWQPRKSNKTICTKCGYEGVE